MRLSWPHSRFVVVEYVTVCHHICATGPAELIRLKQGTPQRVAQRVRQANLVTGLNYFGRCRPAEKSLESPRHRPYCCIMYHEQLINKICNAALCFATPRPTVTSQPYCHLYIRVLNFSEGDLQPGAHLPAPKRPLPPVISSPPCTPIAHTPVRPTPLSNFRSRV